MLEILLNNQIIVSKQNLRLGICNFVSKFVTYRTFKEVIKSVGDDVPKLLNYSNASLFLIDSTGQTLQAMSYDGEKERMKNETYTSGFENEYLIDNTQIVMFPTNVGLQGMSF